jgi:hypothetical protein
MSDQQSVPVPLPLGRTEFLAWQAEIRKLLSPNVANIPDDDISFVLATNITHLGPKVDKLPLEDFVQVVHAAAAKQVAAQIFQEVKLRQQQKLAEDTAAKAAEDGQEKANS